MGFCYVAEASLELVGSAFHAAGTVHVCQNVRLTIYF